MKEKDEIVYALKKDGKYEPVGIYDIGFHYPPGNYLVRVRKNGRGLRSLKKGISLSAAKVELAMSEMSDAIVWALGEADKIEHKPRTISKLEKKAFAAYRKICGEEVLQMSRKSRQEVVDMAMMKVKDLMGQKSTCPEGCFNIFAEKEAK